MNTAELSEAILLAAADDGVRLFRNNSGLAKHVSRDKATGKIKTRHVRYGVGPVGGGGGDFLGWRMSDGKFVSIELKTGHDRQTPDQAKWQRWVIAGNGLAGVARSVDEARAIWCRP